MQQSYTAVVKQDGEWERMRHEGLNRAAQRR
jgi:hypothetical protein